MIRKDKTRANFNKFNKLKNWPGVLYQLKVHATLLSFISVNSTFNFLLFLLIALSLISEIILDNKMCLKFNLLYIT